MVFILIFLMSDSVVFKLVLQICLLFRCSALHYGTFLCENRWINLVYTKDIIFKHYSCWLIGFSLNYVRKNCVLWCGEESYVLVWVLWFMNQFIQNWTYFWEHECPDWVQGHVFPDDPLQKSIITLVSWPRDCHYTGYSKVLRIWHPIAMGKQRYYCSLCVGILILKAYIEMLLICSRLLTSARFLMLMLLSQVVFPWSLYPQHCVFGILIRMKNFWKENDAKNYIKDLEWYAPN